MNITIQGSSNLSFRGYSEAEYREFLRMQLTGYQEERLLQGWRLTRGPVWSSGLDGDLIGFYQMLEPPAAAENDQ
jgi:hypothetical protein